MKKGFKAAAVSLLFATMGAGSAFAQPAPAPAAAPAAPGAPAAPAAPRPGGGLVPLLIESNAFADGGIVPLKFSFYGGSTQPDFKISNAPPTAQTIAIILHDLDVAMGGSTDDVLHWVAWNIPVTQPVTQMQEGKLPEGAVHGRGARGNSYMGMGAPNGPRYHHYVFEFYALNAKLDLPATASRAELLEAMKGKVVGKAAYVGRFRNDTNAPMPAGPPRPAAPPAAAPH
ncbi:MAG: YbhB/YbcL family Raf kinase inhibitor-like protein [Steroidobacteraceae bacterium]